MHEPYLICILVWVNAIEKSRRSANLQQAKICFSGKKGVSESKDVSVNSKTYCWNKHPQTTGKFKTATMFQ